MNNEHLYGSESCDRLTRYRWFWGRSWNTKSQVLGTGSKCNASLAGADRIQYDRSSETLVVSYWRVYTSKMLYRSTVANSRVILGSRLHLGQCEKNGSFWSSMKHANLSSQQNLLVFLIGNVLPRVVWKVHRAPVRALSFFKLRAIIPVYFVLTVAYSRV